MPEALAEEIVEVKMGGPGKGGPPDWEQGGRGGGGDDDESARRRPGGGPSAGMLGMIAMMVSISALFATIVIAFIVRSRTRDYWEPVSLPVWLWISTAFIVASSVTMEAARRALSRFDSRAYSWRLVITFFLGLGFILSQALALLELVQRGFYMHANPHSSLLYIITGAHGVHLIGGMLGLFYLIWRVGMRTRNVRADYRRSENIAAITATYWHFLDGLWVALFVLLLIWK